MKINKLFVVSKNKMLLKAIEIACKNSEKDFFTIDNFDEAVHFAEDIKPDVVVIDTSDALLESEEFQKNMNSNFKVVKLIKKSESESTSHEGLLLELPVNPTSLWRDLEKLIGDSNG